MVVLKTKRWVRYLCFECAIFLKEIIAFVGPSRRVLPAYRHPYEQLSQQWHQQDLRADPVQLCLSQSPSCPHLFWEWDQLWRWICGGTLFNYEIVSLLMPYNVISICVS